MARFTVGDVEDLLFAAYPISDAMPNDRNGLFVGDRAAIVKRIGVALDQTLHTVKAAAAQGCNLLVSHHPPFLYAPDSFLAAASPAVSNGTVIYEAAKSGVALLNMHTNLDCAPATREMLLAPVGLEFVGNLKANGGGSLGQLARPRAQEAEYVLLGELAARYKQQFGAVAKVWGDAHKPLFSLAVCSGGAGEVIPEAIAAGVDCFVTGEVRHHEALYLADAGVSLIELGHDISELPYREVLRDTLVQSGFPNCDIVVLAPEATWWHTLDDEVDKDG